MIRALPLALLAGCHGGEAVPQAKAVRSLLEARQQNVVIQKYDLSCGAAALATLLKYGHGEDVTEHDAAAGMLRRTSIALVQQRLGFSLLDLKRFAQTRGFEADGYAELTLSDLIDFGAAIVPVKLRGFNHFVVFRGVQGDRVLLADPAFGNRTMPIARFEDIWQGRIGFLLRRTDGHPSPNLLAARPSDFWASSGPLRVASPKPVQTAPADALATAAGARARPDHPTPQAPGG
ncbi:C39 family peptidase [Rhodovastum atsumiense]|nr:C39 family peptidase [Rhodovastum atsumiense]CAH2602402.1 C39 family peptidase [Rhodovastum atsumiense]